MYNKKSLKNLKIFERNHKKVGGRKKGTQNKNTYYKRLFLTALKYDL